MLIINYYTMRFPYGFIALHCRVKVDNFVILVMYLAHEHTIQYNRMLHIKMYNATKIILKFLFYNCLLYFGNVLPQSGPLKGIYISYNFTEECSKSPADLCHKIAIVTHHCLCYKEPKSPCNFFSYFNI